MVFSLYGTLTGDRRLTNESHRTVRATVSKSQSPFALSDRDSRDKSLWEEVSLVTVLESGLSSRTSFMSIRCSSVSLSGVVVELRKSKRYRLRAPASFLWKRSDGLLQEGKGTIRDISDRGVFIAGSLAPHPGAHVEVDVYLPGLEGGGSAVQLHGEGTVVRIDREAEGTTGFAAAVAFQTGTAGGPTVVNPKRLQ
jgi:PilZ domain